MKKSLLMGVLLLTILVVLISACSSAATPASTTESTTSNNTTAADDTAVKALIEERCSGCHNTAIIYNANFNESRWSSVIDQMIQKGAVLSDAEKTQVINWLLAQP